VDWREVFNGNYKGRGKFLNFPSDATHASKTRDASCGSKLAIIFGELHIRVPRQKPPIRELWEV